jgi:Predicted esterase
MNALGGTEGEVAFRTFEISDPRFETEHLREITVKSPALGGRADLTVWVSPEAKAQENVPLILLLHGVYGSHWAWARKAGAHRLAAELIGSGELPPCVLAMPSDGLWGDGSGYLPHRAQDFERWIVQEVPAAARKAAACVGGGSRVCLAGLSMGGFGALRLAAKYRERFVAAAGMSSITRFEQMGAFVEEPLGRYEVREEDRSVLEALVRSGGRLPEIRFDCGREDSLLVENRALHAGLTDAGIEHVYEEFPGGHSWDYWREQLPRVLRFFGGAIVKRERETERRDQRD